MEKEIFGLNKKEWFYLEIILILASLGISGMGYLIMDDANYLSTPKWAMYEHISSESFFQVWIIIFLLFNITCILMFNEDRIKKVIKNLTIR